MFLHQVSLKGYPPYEICNKWIKMHVKIGVSLFTMFCPSIHLNMLKNQPFQIQIPVLTDTLEDPQIDSQNDDDDDKKPNIIIEEESFHIYHLEIPIIEPSEEITEQFDDHAEETPEQSDDHAEETTEPSDEPSEENRVEDFSVIQSNVNVNPMSIQ